MKLIIFVELLIILIVFFVVNLMKHWQLMILPEIFISLDTTLQRHEIWFYTILSYLSYFYGNLIGQLAWHWLADNLSSTFALFISLLFMGLFSYLQGLAQTLDSFLLFRFLLGFSMNLEKGGKSFIHEKIAKIHRQPAFYIDSVAYTTGTLSGPIVGLALFHFSPSFADTCKVVALVFFLCAVLHYSLFSMIERDDQPNRSDLPSEADEERIPILKRGTVLNLDWRHTLIHTLWDNRVSRSLLIISLVNACAFHLTLVLTTLYLFDKNDASHHKIPSNTIAQGNMLGGFASLITIAFVSHAVKNAESFKRYMQITIGINAVSTMIMPFFKQLISFLPGKEEHMVWGFFMLKEACCYYLYSQILSYLLSVSVYKLYRKPLNFILTIVKSILYAATFNFVLPILYAGKYFSAPGGTSQTVYVVVFWVVALIQLATLSQFRYIYIVLDKSNMIE